MSSVPILESIEVKQSREVKEKNRIINSIVIGSYIGSILSWIAFIVAAGVFYTSSTLTPDKRVFWASILAVVAIGLQIVVFVVRSEPVYLNIFTLLIVAVSFLSVGLSVSFL
jgi:heme/copper-type cytochrome/quinol oxidase subunit 4